MSVGTICHLDRSFVLDEARHLTVVSVDLNQHQPILHLSILCVRGHSKLLQHQCSSFLRTQTKARLTKHVFVCSHDKVSPSLDPLWAESASRGRRFCILAVSTSAVRVLLRWIAWLGEPLVGNYSLRSLTQIPYESSHSSKMSQYTPLIDPEA